jgi:5-methylcytosine-specific restriction endonuclease McrA
MATRKAGQGSKWIRPTTRLAIYLRDGLCCAYCGHAVEEGERLSLDHLSPASRGGQNDASNLVTCCSHCNSARGNRPLRTWCRAVSAYTGEDAAAIERRVRKLSRRALPRDEAREMIARRAG